MKNLGVCVCVGLGVIASMMVLPDVGSAASETAGDAAALIGSGEASYVAHCASCHGAKGTGDGPVAEYLTVQPTDLTRIEPDATGQFPSDDIYDVIDGRDVPGHGSREMPVWGPAFKGMDESATKVSVQDKIGELVEYLKSIQGSAE